MAERALIDLFGGAALSALTAGDKPTWDRWVIAALPLVRAVVHRALATPDDATLAGAVQEVFVRLHADDYRLLRTFDPARASLATWLAVVAWRLSVSAPCRSPAPRCRAAG
jgi:RNA polymerase sigma-70 factor (ECF subfamily)